jgi:hypothetical protein
VPLSGRSRRSLVLALLGTACPTPDPVAKQDLPAVDTKAEFRAEAQREALDLLLPLTVSALTLHDPVAASTRDRTAIPRLPPVAPGRTEPLRKHVDAAWTEAEGIRADLMPAAPAVLLSLCRFALSRARDQLLRRRPWRDDPTWIVVELDRVIEALEHDAADGTCDACPPALQALAEDLDLTLKDLGAASEPSTTAAADDLLALAARVARLPDATPTATALQDAATHLRAVAAALPRAPAWTHGKPAAPAKTPAEVARLPARIPASDLRRRLEVAEDRDEAPRDLFTALGPTLARLHAMAESRPDKRDASEPGTVDAARCEQAWAPIRDHVATQPALAHASLDCNVAVRRLADRTLRDAELTVALVDLGVVDPIRAARRSEEPPLVALVSGRIAPASQRHAFRLAVLAGLNDDAALLVALDEARAAACLAATALWIHGELGTDSELAPRLEQRCPERPAADWIAAAEARPMQALHGLALDRLGRGPAEVVPLDRYWWAPIGFVSLLAQPERAVQLPIEGHVDVKVQPLDSPEAPAASSARAPPAR